MSHWNWRPIGKASFSVHCCKYQYGAWHDFVKMDQWAEFLRHWIFHMKSQPSYGSWRFVCEKNFCVMSLQPFIVAHPNSPHITSSDYHVFTRLRWFKEEDLYTWKSCIDNFFHWIRIQEMNCDIVLQKPLYGFFWNLFRLESMCWRIMKLICALNIIARISDFTLLVRLCRSNMSFKIIFLQLCFVFLFLYSE